MPWSVQDYGRWYVSTELFIFILVFASSNFFLLNHAQQDNDSNDDDDKVSDYYGYNTGSSIKFECPDDKDWFNVGTQCFKVGTQNNTIQIVNFDDAKALCYTPENYFSLPLNLPNWYKSVELAKLIYPTLINASLYQSAAYQNTSMEIWTGMYFEMEDSLNDCINLPNFNCSVYRQIKVVKTESKISFYTPLWAKSEPKIPTNLQLGISYNIDYKNGDIYGWKVQKQSFYLPTICQTFACFQDEFRCHDNSQCIPFKSKCDQITNCGDGSDENTQTTCLNHTIHKPSRYSDSFGIIYAPATMCIPNGNNNNEDNFCEWHISQTPGAITRINFLDLKLLPEDELFVEGFATGEKLKINPNGPFTHLFVDNELRIQYRPSLKNIENEKNDGNIRGFQLQYMVDETTSCVSKFTSWNGIITTPSKLYDTRKYRPLLDCRWTISKTGSTLLGIQIPLFDLAIGDWLKIYESVSEYENGKLIGTFGYADSPPTAFATHLPVMIFEFHSEKNSPGAGGIVIDFQQTCHNIYLNETHGQIESPGFRNVDNRNPFHCSWIIEVPCEIEDECGITFYFDVLNLTNKDIITIETNLEKILIDSTSLPILSHRIKQQPKVILQMHATQKYFAAQISYSVDCQEPIYNPERIIAKFETYPHVYRSSVDYSCVSTPQLIAQKASCEKGGKWNALPPNCDDSGNFCPYPNIPNGYILNTTDDSNVQGFWYICRKGYKPYEPINVECISKQWNETFNCTEINCGEPDKEYMNLPNPTEGDLNATFTNYTKTTYLGYAYYECEIGEVRGNLLVRLCQENGNWSQPIMYCKLPTCLITDAVIQNGQMDEVYAFANGNVSITCFEGYSLNDTTEDNVAFCDENGKWVKPLPGCSIGVICPVYFNESGVSNPCGWKGACTQIPNEPFFSCHCDQGYWQPDLFSECIDIDECSLNITLCYLGSVCVNTVGNFTCIFPNEDETYTIYNYPYSKNRNFPEDKYLLYDKSVVRKRCQEIYILNFMLQPELSLHLVGEELEMYCTDSQRIINYECGSDSSWNGNISCPIAQTPKCKAPYIERLVVTPDNNEYSLGEHVSFSCEDKRMVLIGPSNTVCALYENDTAAFVSIPTCKWKQCSEIVLDPNTHLQLNNEINNASFVIGSTIYLKCDENYTMNCTNCSSLFCQDNLQWSSELPVCVSNFNFTHCIVQENNELTTPKQKYKYGEKINFQCIQPNYILSDATDIFCGAPKFIINEAAQLKNDMIKQNFWNQRNKRQVPTTNFPQENYGKLLNEMQPHKESIFNSFDISKGWDKSDNWIQTSDGWKYSSNRQNTNNFLISPMIRVQLETGTFDVYAENMNPSSTCMVEVSYFTANYLIAEVPENKFQPILRLNVSSPHQRATIKIIYSILWIMIKAKNCENVNIKQLDISRISCPKLQFGLTSYPSTATSATDVIVRGNCVSQSISIGNPPQLFCTTNGKWQLPIENYNPATCYCNVGYVQQGETCFKKGPICYQCDYGSLDSCTNSTMNYCDIGEACLTKIERNGEEINIEKKCSASCITNFHDIGKCRNGTESCTLCCGDDYCNAMPVGNPDLNKNSNLSAPVPSCIDMQPMEVKCQPSVTVKQIKSAFTEAINIPWPQVIDNSPDFQISSNLILNSEDYIFTGNEKEIQWKGVDSHGKFAQCVTNIIYEDYEKPQLECPDIHIDPRTGTTSKYVPINLPEIKAKDSSAAVHLIYSPPNDTVVEIDYPLLVNVTAIDSAGNIAQCQFWYMAIAADCPLWKIDTDQFICTQSENITVCHRRKPCRTRQLPSDFKAIVCIPGQRWRFVQDITQENRLSEIREMVRTPYCLEQESSNITLSITFRTQSAESACVEVFVAATQIEMNNFVNRHCANVGWIFLAKEVDQNVITFNFTTTSSNTESVLACISEITNSLTRELPQAKIECAPLIKSHTITYHVYCSEGWGSNTNLRCEKCPPGYFSTAEICVPCPQGTYSNNKGARECFPCDIGTSTINDGAISSDECLPFCSLGFYSNNGLAPCRTCPKGTYQNETGGTTCVHCPFNTTTIKSGSHLANDCQQQCSPGQFSINLGGTAPCLNCPKGYYQENFGSDKCEKCLEGTITYLTGASNRGQCIELNCQYTGCKNQGTCINGKCQCKRGFAGYDCSVVVNLCNVAYCLNEAICQFTQNQTLCICKEGFSGTRCEKNLLNHNSEMSLIVTPTNIFPTPNSGGQSTFSGASQSMFSNSKFPTATSSLFLTSLNLPTRSIIPMLTTTPTKLSCTWSINSCSNGKCNHLNGECECNPGFHPNGTDCIQLNACEFILPCFNNGSCIANGSNDYSCNCMNNLGLPNAACAYSGDCIGDSDCNNGTCIKYVDDNKLYGKCFCTQGYNGTYCENELEPCMMKPESCTVCHKFGTDFYCDCDLGYSGEFCEVKFNACYLPGLYYYCKNGGICSLDDNDDAVCDCPDGWEGDDCGSPRDVCKNNICANNSTCVPLFNNYACQCEKGYYGTYCNETIDPCIDIPENDTVKCGHGVCADSSFDEEYFCQCDSNWINGSEGGSCMIPNPDVCEDFDCGINGRCAFDFENNQNICICDDGFSGEFCNNTYCLDSFCEPGGECVPEDGGYHCICNGGVIAQTCVVVSPCDNVTATCGNGTCVEDGAESFHCTCNLGYVGDHCEIKIPYCNQNNIFCNNGGTCKNNPDGDGGNCVCLTGFYGDYCQNIQDSKYNLYFTGVVSNISVESKPIVSRNILNPFTLCSWVRPGDNPAIETNAHANIRLQESPPFLQVKIDNTNKDVLISMASTYVNINGINITYPLPNKAAGWNYICLQTLNETTAVIYVNAQIKSVSTFTRFPNFKENAIIVLAPPQGNTTFQGELSYAEMYEGAINSSIISDIVSDCKILNAEKHDDLIYLIYWKDYTTTDRFNTEIIVVRPGICSLGMCVPGSTNCNSKEDNVPPKIIACPDDTHIESQTRWQKFFYNPLYDIFTDDGPIKQITTNYRSGQYFQWGQYKIIINATDNNDNSAVCQFLLTLYPNKTDDWQIPDNSTEFHMLELNVTNSTGSDKQIRQIGTIQCVDEDYVIAQDYAPFYVCDIMGQWQRYANSVQTDFSIPQCVKSILGKQTLNGTLTLSNNSMDCSDLSTKINQIIQTAEVCKNECIVLFNISANSICNKRFKRATNNETLGVSFFVSTDKSRLPIRESVVQALQNELENSAVVVRDARLTCSDNQTYPVRVTNDQQAVCSMTPKGTIWNKTLTKCPINTYKNITGPCNTTEGCCIQCPNGTVTAQDGTITPSDCYKNCSAGNFFDIVDKKECEPCSKTSYQPYYGKLHCQPCPNTAETTGKFGSTNASDCHLCDPGQEIGDGDCMKCPTATYNNGSNTACQECPNGLTTSSTGSKSIDDCNIPNCPPGSKLATAETIINATYIFANGACILCPTGQYQPDFNQTFCYSCDLGNTTIAMSNSSQADACIPIDDLTCNFQDPNACREYNMSCICYKFPGTQICNYLCGVPLIPQEPVNDESNELWWISLLIAFFILVLVLVIVTIVWRKQMASCCCTLIRLPPFLMDCLPEGFKNNVENMRITSMIRSRTHSIVSAPMDFEEESKESDIMSMQEITLPKINGKGLADEIETEQETCVDDPAINNIRQELRQMVSDPEVEPVLPPQPRQSSIRQRLQSPKTTAMGLRVQTKRESQENQNNFQHIAKDNGHAIKATSYSKKNVQNDSYSISVSQNVNSNADKEFVTGPPVFKWLQDKMAHDNQKPADQSMSMQVEQNSNLDAISSPDWPAFNPQQRRRSSSSNSATMDFKSFESNKDEYFNKATEYSKAFTRSSETSEHQTGSFYARNSRVRPYNSPPNAAPATTTKLNNIDDDPDAFFS